MATTPELTVVPRDKIQGMTVKAARRSGNIPGVIYSRNQPTKSFYADEREVVRLINEFGISRRINVDLGSEKKSAIIKEIQRDYLKNKILHVDLQALVENEKISLPYSIHISNRDEMERGDYILQVQMSEVELEMFPRHMPDSVEVDATLLREKDNITVADLNVAGDENIEILSDPETVVATLVYIQQVEEEPEEGEEEVAAADVPTVDEEEDEEE